MHFDRRLHQSLEKSSGMHYKDGRRTLGQQQVNLLADPTSGLHNMSSDLLNIHHNS
jgi:hypothetical protein